MQHLLFHIENYQPFFHYLEGIRILAEAMSGIKDSTDNNAEGARKLDSASMNISELSNRLKENTENFRI